MNKLEPFGLVEGRFLFQHVLCLCLTPSVTVPREITAHRAIFAECLEPFLGRKAHGARRREKGWEAGKLGS